MDNKRIYITVDEQKELDETKRKYQLDENAQLSCKKNKDTKVISNQHNKKLVKM
jgi:hypothetical protein